MYHKNNPFQGQTPPTGFFICDGSAISRTGYAELFAEIGTTYGAGDGATTFNLPNFNNKIPWQDNSQTIGTISEGMLPNITGTVDTGVGHGHSTGAFYQSSTHQYAGLYANTNYVSTFDASRSSSVYKSVSIVVPACVFVGGWCIKY